MKRILIAIIGIIAALLLIVTIIGFFYVGTIVKVGIEKFGPQITKVPVTVDMVNVSSFYFSTPPISNVFVFVQVIFLDKVKYSNTHYTCPQ